MSPVSGKRRLGGAPALPVFVLAGLSTVDQFDTAAFGLLAPEIVADFHADATTFGFILLPQLLLALVLPLVFGYIADRTSRVRLTVFGAALWVISGFLSGIAPTIAVLGAFRLLAAIAKGPGPAHQSLLADYYPTEARGFAYAMYNASFQLGPAVGLLAAGFIGQYWGWRQAFIILALPGVVLTLLALRMRDPVRGLIDAQEAGESEAPQQSALGPIRAARLLLKTPTFKRLCWATAVTFSAVVGSGVTLSFYFSTVFDVGAGLRGVFNFMPLPFSLLTLFAGGAYAQRLLTAGKSKKVVQLSALMLAIGGSLFAGLAFAPAVWVAVLASTAAVAVSTFAVLPLQLLLARLVPAHIRSQGFGIFGFFQFAFTGIALLFGLSLGDRLGFRATILIFVPLLLLGAFLMWTATFSVARDIQRMDDTAMAKLHARRRQAEGGDTDVLEVRGVNAGYGNVQILFDVDFHVRTGEVVALLGTNGAGKSTLLRVISGLLTPTTGTILLDGDDITGLDTELTAQRGVIQVPGGRGVFPGLSVARNLELGTYLYWNEPDYIEQAQRDVLQLFPRLAERMKQPAGTLSGGEQQMLTLAQSLMSRPRILMIDELSLGLAPIVVQELLVAVREISARGTPIVLVEQSVNIALTLADRAYFLEKGEVRFDGATRELMERGDLLRSIFLEGAGTKMGTGT
jgi:branched-chain amino acid transport system ATP-binding protein